MRTTTPARRSRRTTKTVEVTRGRLIGYGKTKTEAKADLEQQIDVLCKETEPHIEVRFGILIVVARIGRHIASQIIFSDYLGSHGKEMRFSSFGTGTFESEIMRARISAAQNVWSIDLPESADREFIAKAGVHANAEAAAELRRWIAWQRSYAKLKADGKTDAEAHQQACWS
jgi:hypothetical protein